MRDIVLDTNCLLASLPKKSPYRAVWDAFLDAKFCLCYTTDILDEYEEILSRNITPMIARNVIKTILERKNVKEITVYYRFGLIEQDPDDNKFVDCAVAAKAEYIVTNDAHFNVLKTIPFPQVDIICLQKFVEMLQSTTFA